MERARKPRSPAPWTGAAIAAATLGCLCGDPTTSAPAAPEETAEALAVEPAEVDLAVAPLPRHVPLPDRELVLPEHFPTPPELPPAELRDAPIAVQTGCVPGLMRPEERLASDGPAPAGRWPGPCRKTTYYDGQARDHTEYRYDARRRLVASYSYNRGEHYRTTLLDYDDQGHAVGWRVSEAEAEDMEGTFRCDDDPSAHTLRVTRAHGLDEALTDFTMRYDDARRPLLVTFASSGRTLGYAWAPGADYPDADSPHRYAYHAPSRTLYEEWRDLGYWQFWTHFREDGQPERRIVVRNGEPNEWAVHLYDDDGNLLERKDRGPSGQIRHAVLAYDCF